MTSFIFYVLVWSYVRTELDNTTINAPAPIVVDTRPYTRIRAPVSRQSNEDVKYLDEHGEEQTESATKITTKSTTLTGGWFYVEGSVGNGETTISENADVKVILTDGCDWKTQIRGSGTAALTIFAQSAGTSAGKLTTGYTNINDAGINVPTVTINGGVVNVSGGDRGSGIGGGQNEDGVSVTINAGLVEATGGVRGSGIGGGRNGSGGILTVNGGTVKVKGGYSGAAIGGGSEGDGGSVIINGGVVSATGGEDGAGIGGGDRGNGGTVVINGGVVMATGGEYGSGIGGGNYGGNGASVTIKDGTVVAQGGKEASGIGGGSIRYATNCANGGTVVITGGSVKALRGEGGSADIGAGKGGADNGTLRNDAGSDVYLNNITIKDDGSDNAPVTNAVIGGVSSYGFTDVVTDDQGRVYFYLPSSAGKEEVLALTVGGKEYERNYIREPNHGNNIAFVTCADLTPEERIDYKCPDPDAGAARLKRPLALAVIVAAIAWLM